jgi:hypothetical protein
VRLWQSVGTSRLLSDPIYATARRTTSGALRAESQPGGRTQHVVMKLCGWKTDAMFRRYAIVDERDLRHAVELLAKGTIEGQAAVKSAQVAG